MKIDTYQRHKEGTLLNIKIKNGIERLVNSYMNDKRFKGLNREDIYDVIIDECIEDCKSNSNYMLDITLGHHNIPYLLSLKKQNTIKEERLFDELN